MRDIRQDLEERIARLKGEIEALTRVLEIENERATALLGANSPLISKDLDRVVFPPPIVQGTRRDESELGDLILGILRERPMDKDEITARAARTAYFHGNSVSAGRAVHIALANLERGRKVTRLGDRYVKN